MGITTTLYLVRHGETDWNATERCQGALDIPMNDAGRRQAQGAGVALQGVHFDAAYTSTLGRAQDTAAAILAGREISALPVAELGELSYGEWHGLRPDEWPDATGARWRRAPWSVAFPGGESLAVLRDRVIPTLRRIIADHAGHSVLIASHGHVNRLMLIDALGADPNAFWDIEQLNGGVVKLDVIVAADGSIGRATARQIHPEPAGNGEIALRSGDAGRDHRSPGSPTLVPDAAP